MKFPQVLLKSLTPHFWKIWVQLEYMKLFSLLPCFLVQVTTVPTVFCSKERKWKGKDKGKIPQKSHLEKIIERIEMRSPTLSQKRIARVKEELQFPLSLAPSTIHPCHHPGKTPSEMCWRALPSCPGRALWHICARLGVFQWMRRHSDIWGLHINTSLWERWCSAKTLLRKKKIISKEGEGRKQRKVIFFF